MKKQLSLLLLATALIASAVCSSAQAKDFSRAEIDQLSSKYEPVFQAVLDWLAKNPELKPGDKERELILKTLDPALAEEPALDMPVVGRFFRERINAFLSDFEKTRPLKGAIVWKLYNHTHVIRTPQLTVAVDLYSGYDQVKWDDDALDRAIAGVDVILITHPHGDHMDEASGAKFIKAGKMVIVPGNMWTNVPFADKLTRMRDGSITVNGVKITVFPGFQKETPCNAYLVETADGLKIMHIGDSNEVQHPVDAWYKRFKKKPLAIDALIPNCWSPNLAVLLKFVKPKIIISSHEHELGHDVAGRRSYQYVYSVLSTVKVPFLVPMWGEKVLLPRVE